MNTIHLQRFAALLAGAALCSFSPRAACQGTAFTYQGNLNGAAGPATGSYDLRFALYDSTNNPGTMLAGPITNAATAVSNGLFTTTLDFGPDPFNGAPVWLELAVRTNGGGPFTMLAPRQQITPEPYALYAANATVAATAGSVAATNLTGSLSLAQLPSTVLTNNASGITLNGTFSGKFISSNFRATQVLNRAGPLPVGASFTTGGGTLLVFVSGSAYAQVPGSIGMAPIIQGAAGDFNLPYVRVTANQTLTHLAFVPQQFVVTGVPAGTYELDLGIINYDYNTTSDAGDNFSATVIELPF